MLFQIRLNSFNGIIIVYTTNVDEFFSLKITHLQMKKILS